MKHLILSLLLLGSLMTFAQKEKKSTGEYQLNLTRSNMSELEACDYCKEMARVQAIEKIFGTVIVQGNSMLIKNKQGNTEVESEQLFSMIAETYVNGDWIKTIKEDCDRFVDGDEFWIKCKVKGLVRKLSQARMDLQVQTLSCAAAQCEKVHYKNGDPFFVNFKTPKSGYITVYLADGEVAQRIFPYRNMPSEDLVNGLKVKADEDYILFSKAEDKFGLGSYVDEYELFAETAQDLNRVYIIWTEAPIMKPSLSENKTSTEAQLPLELPAKKFKVWLSENRRYHTDMQVKRLDITISE